MNRNSAFGPVSMQSMETLFYLQWRGAEERERDRGWEIEGGGGK